MSTRHATFRRLAAAKPAGIARRGRVRRSVASNCRHAAGGMLRFAMLWALWIHSSMALGATISIADHGALPDDDLEDSTAINQAIEHAAAGDTVYFPAGTYRLASAIEGKSSVHLQGDPNSPSVLLCICTAAVRMIRLPNATNATVSHLVLDGNNSTNAKVGVYAASATGLQLHHLNIRNLSPNAEGPLGIMFSSDVTHSTIASNHISNIGTGTEWGAGIRMSWRSSSNLVADNVITNTGRGGILCDNDSTDLEIRGNTLMCSGGHGLGIELWGRCHRGIVEDNVMSHWLSVDSSDQCAIRRNTISNKDGTYKWCALEAVASSHCVYADNLVDGGATCGISQTGTSPTRYLLWTRNTIKGCGTWGAQLYGEDEGCSAQYFYQNKFRFSNRDQPPAAYADQGTGFRFYGNCHHIVLDANDISMNEGRGFQNLGAFAGDLNYISIINNTITNNGGYSVVDGFGSALEWAGNTVSGNGADTQLASRGLVDAKPVAAFTCPDVVQINEATSFSNASFDPDGTIQNVLWDFGEGLPSTNMNPQHVYAEPGVYVVTLVVWDNIGRAAISTKTVTVPAGNLVVYIAPAAAQADARWRVDDGPWQIGGAVVDKLAPGTHMVSFNVVSNYDSPGDVEVTIADGSTTTNTGNYVRHAGTLAVTMGPADAPGAGARWRRTGTSIWQISGAAETNIPTGDHVVEFLDLGSPWVSPSNIQVTVAKNGATNRSVRYNRPPIVSGPECRFLYVDETLSFPLSASDPDGDEVALVVGEVPDGGMFTQSGASGTFHFVPSPEQAGQLLTVTFTATETYQGLTASHVVLLQVGAISTRFHRFRWWTMDGFGGHGSNASYVSESAGAQGQPVGPGVSDNHSHSAGFLLAEEAVAVIVSSAAPGGSILPNGVQEVVLGSGQIFQIVPDAYYAIADVVVDGLSLGATNSYRFEHVLSNRTIHAQFSELLTVQGVPQWWLASHGLTNQPWDEAAALDHGAGVPAWEAWVAGTDPTNSATTFRILSCLSLDERLQMAVRTVPGRIYTIWAATNLIVPDWRRISYSLTAEGSLTNGNFTATGAECSIYMPIDDYFFFVRPEVKQSGE